MNDQHQEVLSMFCAIVLWWWVCFAVVGMLLEAAGTDSVKPKESKSFVVQHRLQGNRSFFGSTHPSED